MYINILHLLWITPAVAFIYVFALAMVRADKQNDENNL